MLLDKLFEPFLKATPICVMARGVLQRLLDPHHIDQLFLHTARRQYTNELLFFTKFLVSTMGTLSDSKLIFLYSSCAVATRSKS